MSIEALRGRTIVVKIGSLSEVTFSNAHLTEVLKDVLFLKGNGVNPVVVHGGGEEASEVMKSRGLQPVFFGGLRVTDKPALEVLMEVMPRIGAETVKFIMGVLGGDAEQVLGHERLLRVAPLWGSGLGYVGEVVNVNVDMLRAVMAGGTIPVVTPLGSYNSNVCNVNGDEASSAIAVALKSARLVFVTDVDGVMDGPNLLRMIDSDRIYDLLRRGVIHGGMEPKVNAGISAKRNGVGMVSIINGTKDRALLHEVLSDEGTGTVILA